MVSFNQDEQGDLRHTYLQDVELHERRMRVAWLRL